MNSQLAQDRRPANLRALREGLQEIAASRKAPATEKKPLVIQEPVMVVRGKQATLPLDGAGSRRYSAMPTACRW
jgi:hypothetical protein